MAPAFLFSLGSGAATPILASYSVERGATLAIAAVIVALMPIGQIIADLPAGKLAARCGEHRAMIISSLTAALGFAAAGVAPSLITLGISIVLIGMAGSVFQLARHSYLTEVVAPQNRARVMSTLGGVNRSGRLIGPFLGAAIALNGDLRWVFGIGVITCLSAVITVLLAARHGKGVPDAPAIERMTRKAPPSPATIRSVLRSHSKLLATLGLSAALVGAIRSARRQVVPLWGEAINLDPATIAVIFGLANAVDLVLFYPAGQVMDRFGRLWIAVPCMTGLAVAMALVPFTSTAVGLGIIGVLLGLTNGLGAGIMMTISADLAPEQGRTQFLSVWRLTSHIGQVAGPMTIAAGTAAFSLSIGIWAAAAYGPASVFGLARWLPRYSVHANRSSRRRAGLSKYGT